MKKINVLKNNQNIYKNSEDLMSEQQIISEQKPTSEDYSEKVKKAIHYTDAFLFIDITSRNPKIIPIKKAGKEFLFLTGDDNQPIMLLFSEVCSILKKDFFDPKDLLHNELEQDTRKLCEEIANRIGRTIYRQTGFVKANGLGAIGPFDPVH